MYQHASAGNYPAVSMDKLDWKRWLGSAPDQPFRPERFFQWRHFWDFGGGCVTDLMTHWIDVVHWYMNVDAPLSAVATGRNYNLKTWARQTSFAGPMCRPTPSRSGRRGEPSAHARADLADADGSGAGRGRVHASHV
jgi:predicted dehydrogenase